MTDLVSCSYLYMSIGKTSKFSFRANAISFYEKTELDLFKLYMFVEKIISNELMTVSLILRKMLNVAPTVNNLFDRTFNVELPRSFKLYDYENMISIGESYFL